MSCALCPCTLRTASTSARLWNSCAYLSSPDSCPHVLTVNIIIIFFVHQSHLFMLILLSMYLCIFSSVCFCNVYDLNFNLNIQIWWFFFWKTLGLSTRGEMLGTHCYLNLRAVYPSCPVSQRLLHWSAPQSQPMYLQSGGGLAAVETPANVPVRLRRRRFRAV